MSHLRDTVKRRQLGDAIGTAAMTGVVFGIVASILTGTRGCTDMRTEPQKGADARAALRSIRLPNEVAAPEEEKKPVLSVAEKEYWRASEELTERQKPDFTYELATNDVTPWVEVDELSRDGKWVARCTARCEFFVEWDDGRRTADFNEPGKMEFFNRPGRKWKRVQWLNKGEKPVRVRIWFYGSGPEMRRERARLVKRFENPETLEDCRALGHDMMSTARYRCEQKVKKLQAAR